MQRPHPLDEGRRVVAVDHAVIEGRREVHRSSRNEAAVAPDRPPDDLVDADDRHFRPVDHRRRRDAAERAERGQRDRRTRKLLARRDALARRFADPPHLARALMQAQRLRVAHHRDHQPDRRLGRNPEMHGAEARDDVVVVVVMRVDLRKVRGGLNDGEHEEGQHRQLRPILGRARVERGAQFLERRHVDFLDVGEMRHASRRFGHVLRDAAAQAHDLDRLDRHIRLFARALRRRLGRAGDVSFEIVVSDAPGGSRAAHEAQIDARFARSLAHRRRGERPFARGTRRAGLGR